MGPHKHKSYDAEDAYTQDFVAVDMMGVHKGALRPQRQGEGRSCWKWEVRGHSSEGVFVPFHSCYH